jgi:amino-acid N-acetyltransferase
MRTRTLDASITAAGGRDYGEVIALLEAASLPTEDLERSSMEQFLVAREPSGKVIGAIGFGRYGSAALLRSLVVATENRDRTLGTQLVAELEARCRSLALSELYLLTTTAQEFFLRRGYKTIQRDSVPGALRAAAEFTRLCPDSAVCMTKSL